MSKASYSFPVLKNKEILACLKELQVPLTLNELKEPNPQQMRGIYESFVEILMGQTKEELSQPQFPAIDNLSFPELHEDSIGELTLSKYLLKLMRAAGMSDCSLKDFVMPTYGRTKKILSALINFAKFREDRLQVYQEFTQQTDEMDKVRSNLEAENNALKERLKSLQEQREAEAPQVEALEAETASLTEKISELNKTHRVIRDEVKAMKENSTALADKIANHKFMLLNEKQECDKLKSQIVRSPERLKRTLVDMEVSMNVSKKDVQEVTARLKELQTKHQALSKVDNKIAKRIVQLQESQDQLKKSKQAHQIMKERSAKIDGNQKDMAELVAQEQHLKQSISNGQDKLFRLQRQFEQKRHQAQMALDQVQSEKMAMTRNMAKDKKQIEHNNAIVERKRKELEAMQAEHNLAMTELRTRYSQLGKEVEGFHKRMMVAMHGAASDKENSVVA